MCTHGAKSRTVESKCNSNLHFFKIILAGGPKLDKKQARVNARREQLGLFCKNPGKG